MNNNERLEFISVLLGLVDKHVRNVIAVYLKKELLITITITIVIVFFLSIIFSFWCFSMQYIRAIVRPHALCL